jgi:hypothetical protein
VSWAGRLCQLIERGDVAHDEGGEERQGNLQARVTGRHAPYEEGAEQRGNHPEHQRGDEAPHHREGERAHPPFRRTALTVVPDLCVRTTAHRNALTHRTATPTPQLHMWRGGRERWAACVWGRRTHLGQRARRGAVEGDGDGVVEDGLSDQDDGGATVDPHGPENRHGRHRIDLRIHRKSIRR